MTKLVHIDPSTVHDPWTPHKLDRFKSVLKCWTDDQLLKVWGEVRTIPERPSVAEENEIRLKDGRPPLQTFEQFCEHERHLVYLQHLYDKMYQPLLDEVSNRGLDLA